MGPGMRESLELAQRYTAKMEREENVFVSLHEFYTCLVKFALSMVNLVGSSIRRRAHEAAATAPESTTEAGT